jgi:hypothetical protein
VPPAQHFLTKLRVFVTAEFACERQVLLGGTRMKWAALSIVPVSLFLAHAARSQEWEDASPEVAEEEPSVEPEAEAAPEPVVQKEAAPVKAKPAEPASAPRRKHHAWRRWRADGSLSLSVGKARLDVDALDERLSEHGYEPISDRAIQVGLLGMKVFPGGLVLGLGGSYTGTRASAGPNGSEVHAHIGHLYGMLGGAAVKSKRWLLAPAVMLGGYRLKVEVDASDSASFDELVGDPGRGVNLTQTGWFAGGMIVLDRRIQWRRDPSRYTSIGLRLGVMEAVSASGWRFSDDRAEAGPEVLPRVGFLSLALGFGRYGR